MKNIVRIASIALVAVMLVCMLASCSPKLSGSYKNDGIFGVGATTYTFKGSNVTITTEVGGFEKTVEGKYEIDDETGKITLTFEAEEEDAEAYAGTFDFAQGEENGVKYIKIGGAQYTKVEK